MKTIQAKGINFLTELRQSGGWYWGSDYASGDLYEAENLFHLGHEIRCNRLLFLHYPSGRVVEPVKAKEGQYFASPVFYDGGIYLLLVDFPGDKICIQRYETEVNTVEPVTALPLSSVPDCYNLMLHTAPLMLIREGSDQLFQIVWPEKAQFPLERRESFNYRQGDRLYFSRWEEDPDYREEVVVRSYPKGEILEIMPGTLWEFPDGEHWLLK